MKQTIRKKISQIKPGSLKLVTPKMVQKGGGSGDSATHHDRK